MFIKVLSRSTIKEFKTGDKHIVISVRDPESGKAELPKQKSRLDTLFLSFHDLDQVFKEIVSEDCEYCKGTGYLEEYKNISNGRCFRCNPPENLILFATNMAELIWTFVNKYKDKVKLIVVNCEAGISRSAGIAGALSKVLDGDDDFYFKHYCPNRLVYRTVLEVGMNKIQKED